MLKAKQQKFKKPFSENVCDNKPAHNRKRIKRTFTLNEGLIERLEVLHHFADYGSISKTVEAAIEQFLKEDLHKDNMVECYTAWEAQGD